MNCNHETFRCTNGVFSCLKCGAVVPNPYKDKQQEAQGKKPAEAPKTARKRKTAQK